MLTCILLYFIGKEIFNKKVGILTAIIASFYGPLIFYNGVLLRATVVIFLNALLLFMLIRLRKKPTKIHGLLAGMAFGLSYITRENILLPLILVWLFIILRRLPIKKILAVTGLLLIGICLIFAPSIIRNYIVLDTFTINPTTPRILWTGLTYDIPAGSQAEWDGRVDGLAAKYGKSIKGVGLYLMEEMKKDPMLFTHIYFKKIRTFFNGYEVPANLNYYLFREFPNILRSPLFTFTFILPLALIGIFLALRSKEGAGILYIFLFALSIVVIPVRIESRYRIVAVPFFIIFAAYGLNWFLHQLKAKKYRPLAISVPVFFALFLFVLPDATYVNNEKRALVRSIDYRNFAYSYVWRLTDLRDQGKELNGRFLNGGIKYIEKTVELFPYEPTTVAFHYYLGVFYFEKGWEEKARKAWELTSRTDPSFRISTVLTGYKIIEPAEEAIIALKARLEKDPSDLEARYSLANNYLWLGRVDQAIAEYKNMLYHSPYALRLYGLLKFSHDVKGLSKEEIQKGLKGINDLTIMKIDRFSPYYQLGIEYLDNENYDKAIGWFKQGLAEQPHSLNALINIGVACRAAGRPEEAISFYEQALKLAPEIMPARYNLVMVLLSEGRFEEAIPHLEYIVEIFPEYMFSQFHLAVAYEQIGLNDKALQEYNSFISLAKGDPRKQEFVGQAKDRLAVLEWKLRKID